MSRQTEITYSRDGTLYYVSHPIHRPRHWLSVKPTQGEVPEKERHGTFDGAAEIRLNTGEVYWRKTYAFAFYEIKSGRTEPLDENSELFKDYASVSGWPEPQSAAFAKDVGHELANTRQLLRDAEEEAQSYRERVAELEAALATRVSGVRDE